MVNLMCNVLLGEVVIFKLILLNWVVFVFVIINFLLMICLEFGDRGDSFSDCCEVIVLDFKLMWLI